MNSCLLPWTERVVAVQGWRGGTEPFLNLRPSDKLRNRAAGMSVVHFHSAGFKFAGMQIGTASACSCCRSEGGLLNIDIGEVLETISDPKIPVEREL